MNWQQICEDPQLRNLPYKIELNETGQLIMTPARCFLPNIGNKLKLNIKAQLLQKSV